MAWKIEISSAPMETLAKMDRRINGRILGFLTAHVAALDNPRSVGTSLKGPKFGDLWKYRKGDYRILCQILEEKKTVLVVRIGHRKDVYR